MHHTSIEYQYANWQRNQALTWRLDIIFVFILNGAPKPSSRRIYYEFQGMYMIILSVCELLDDGQTSSRTGASCRQKKSGASTLRLCTIRTLLEEHLLGYLYIAIPLCKTKLDLNQSSFRVQSPIYPPGQNITPIY